MLEKYQKMHVGKDLLGLVRELHQAAKVYNMLKSEENLKAVVDVQSAMTKELKNRHNPDTAVKFIYITCDREVFIPELYNVLVKFQMEFEDYYGAIKKILKRVDKKSLEFKLYGGFWEVVNYKYELHMLKGLLISALEIESIAQQAIFTPKDYLCNCGGEMNRVSTKWNHKGVLLSCRKCRAEKLVDGYDLLLTEVNNELSNFKEEI